MHKINKKATKSEGTWKKEKNRRYGRHNFFGFDQDTFKGIISEAFALGYDVATFSLFTRNGEETPYQAGEENIFNLLILTNLMVCCL